MYGHGWHLTVAREKDQPMTQNNNNNPTVAPATDKTVTPAILPAAVQTLTADVPKVEIADKK